MINKTDYLRMEGFMDNDIEEVTNEAAINAFAIKSIVDTLSECGIEPTVTLKIIQSSTIWSYSDTKFLSMEDYGEHVENIASYIAANIVACITIGLSEQDTIPIVTNLTNTRFKEWV